MIAALVGWCIGAVGVAVAWRSTRSIFESYVFQRQNYRDHRLPTAAGLLCVLVLCAVVAVVEVLSGWSTLFAGSLGWVSLRVFGPSLAAIVLGFGFIGLIDDLGGTGQSGGFVGHLRALGHGQVTTGAVKALGGPMIALSVLPHSMLATDTLGLLRDAAIVSLSANLVNLFDRAPGRAIKFGLFCFALEVVALRSPVLGAVGVVSGGSAALLGPDLREELMLGDTGANVVGAALGFALVIVASSTVNWVALAVLVAFNLASEFVSFSKVIGASRALRWLDELGAVHRQHRP